MLHSCAAVELVKILEPSDSVELLGYAPGDYNLLLIVETYFDIRGYDFKEKVQWSELINNQDHSIVLYTLIHVLNDSQHGFQPIQCRSM